MSTGSLFPDDVRPTRTPKPRPQFTCSRPSREQYRRTEDEDAGGLAECHFGDDGEVSLAHYEKTGEVRYRPEPELVATVACPVVPDDVYDGVPAEWLEVARHFVERFQHPVRLPPDTPPDAARSIMAAVYHMRHANRMRLRLPEERPADPSLPGWDLVTAINRLCKLFREEVLARAGHRTMAHGVFPIDKRNPSKGYRTQVWDTSKEKRNSLGEVVIGGKLHICYKKTEEEAWAALAEWFLKKRGLDVRKYLCYHPDSAIAMLASMMKKAAANSNDYVEVDAKELYGSDDEEWD